MYCNFPVFGLVDVRRTVTKNKPHGCVAIVLSFRCNCHWHGVCFTAATSLLLSLLWTIFAACSSRSVHRLETLLYASSLLRIFGTNKLYSIQAPTESSKNDIFNSIRNIHVSMPCRAVLIECTCFCIFHFIFVLILRNSIISPLLGLRALIRLFHIEFVRIYPSLTLSMVGSH